MTWATPVLLALLSDPVSAPQCHLQLARFRALALQSCLERPLDVFAYHITLKVYGRPAEPLRPMVVTAAVCGMMVTWNPSGRQATTVRLMPSTAIEPLGTM